MLFYIKLSKLFSVNGGSQNGCPPIGGIRSGLDPALVLGSVVIQLYAGECTPRVDRALMF